MPSSRYVGGAGRFPGWDLSAAVVFDGVHFEVVTFFAMPAVPVVVVVVTTIALPRSSPTP